MPTTTASEPGAGVGAARPTDSPAAAALTTLADRPDLLDRWLRGLIADALRRLRRAEVPAAEVHGWPADLDLGPDGLGFDSLALIDLIADLTARLRLADTGIEDYFLVRPHLSQWVALLAAHLRLLAARPDPSLGFRTAGSTGAPVPVVHRLADLVAEVDGIAAAGILGTTVSRVVALVPPQHIYGFLFTVLMPSQRHVPVEDLRHRGPGSVLGATRPSDLLVATPYLWAMLSASGGQGAAIAGLTSTAPAPPDLWSKAARAGIERLVEIYGASQTAGVGWRPSPNTDFEVLPHLDRTGDRVNRRNGGAALPLQDRICWTGARTFRTLGRLDGAVQVGGINVSLRRVTEAIEALPQVAEVAVRRQTGAEGRLKAFVVPAPGVPATGLPTTLRQALSATLNAAEMPVSITIGPALPRDGMGKSADWPDSAV